MRKASEAEIEKQRIQLAAIKVGALIAICFDDHYYIVRSTQFLASTATACTAFGF